MRYVYTCISYIYICLYIRNYVCVGANSIFVCLFHQLSRHSGLMSKEIMQEGNYN